ncbi:putative short chain oxidoreductase [Aspergillus campestris IBT 28561]|uniref:Short chain oxidoreductase n=1 Tax=Aspergillus campestris (strain IBT 28561) TaxID=1392248 RepID=A0A2I1CXM5_ASPC2|nr:putative short chain oxidoreductase [Aspergillus campestris IBT 28561]PKY02379.1 putative short chain oxidoreductase [Aspergillus campestris IBT 28561]
MASYLVTGASRGLGLALVQQLAARPATEVASIVATARQPRELPSLVEASRGRIAYVPLDTTSASSVAEAVDRIQRTHGNLDVLINNAGVGSYTRGGVTEMDATDLTDVMNTNVTGTHRVTQAFLPLLRRGTRKSIVNISTTMASLDKAQTYKDMPVPAYRISKAALNMLTVQYAHALADEGFACFAVSPGWLRTDLGGSRADLSAEQGADAVLDIVREANTAQNGKFLNVRVPGWENHEGLNQYDGRELPW